MPQIHRRRITITKKSFRKEPSPILCTIVEAGKFHLKIRPKPCGHLCCFSIDLDTMLCLKIFLLTLRHKKQRGNSGTTKAAESVLEETAAIFFPPLWLFEWTWATFVWYVIALINVWSFKRKYFHDISPFASQYCKEINSYITSKFHFPQKLWKIFSQKNLQISWRGMQRSFG